VASVGLRDGRIIVRLLGMEPPDALNILVDRAVERTGAKSKPALFRDLRMSSDYLYKWREMLRQGRDGPSFRNILPLLEAAGVFASGSSAAADLADEIDRLKALTGALEAQQTPQQQRREATGG